MFSPDGKKIAYVSFSNAEKDGGYMLEVADSDGSNAKQLVNETSPITQPIWNSTGDQIAYLRQQNSTTSAIVTISAAGGTAKTLASFTNRVPYDLAWSSDNHLAFVDGTGDQAQLYEITTTATDPAVLTTPTGRESRPVYAPNSQGLAFVLTNGSVSTAYSFDRAAQKFSALAPAKIVLGWIRRQP
jgi:TolB protein